MFFSRANHLIGAILFLLISCVKADGSFPTWAIIAAAAGGGGGLLLIIIIVVVICCVCCRKEEDYSLDYYIEPLPQPTYQPRPQQQQAATVSTPVTQPMGGIAPAPTPVHMPATFPAGARSPIVNTRGAVRDSEYYCPQYNLGIPPTPTYTAATIFNPPAPVYSNFLPPFAFAAPNPNPLYAFTNNTVLSAPTYNLPPASPSRVLASAAAKAGSGGGGNHFVPRSPYMPANSSGVANRIIDY